MQSARKDKGISHDKDVYVSRRPELQEALNFNGESSTNVTTMNSTRSGAGAARLGEHLNFKIPPKPVQPMEVKSDARRLRLQHESRSPFDPPPPPSILRNVSARRKEQVAREGLTESRKLLSVGNTIGALDGFPQGNSNSGFLPQISEQRRARKILGKQMQSTFSLG